jgi:hypothetical protein
LRPHRLLFVAAQLGPRAAKQDVLARPLSNCQVLCIVCAPLRLEHGDDLPVRRASNEGMGWPVGVVHQDEVGFWVLGA